MRKIFLCVALLTIVSCGQEEKPQTPSSQIIERDVTLIWDANVIEDQVTEYRMYRGVDTECGTVDPLIEMIGASTTITYVDVKIPIDGKVRCWEVTAYNGLESGHSNRASAIIGQ